MQAERRLARRIAAYRQSKSIEDAWLVVQAARLVRRLRDG